MKRNQLALLTVLTIGWAGTGLALTNLNLIAVADGSIQENKPTTASATSRLQVRSNTAAGRQNSAYIRFDLNVLAGAPEANAVFSVSRDPAKLTTFSSGQVHVYGLLDTAGNTPQQWNEGITYDSSGLEVPSDGDALTQDLDLTRVVFIGNLPPSLNPGVDGELFPLSTPALDTFLADRFAADGFATLMLVEESGADRELYFTHRETTSSNLPPTLAVVGELGGGSVDTTPPTVAIVSPTNGATAVEVSDDVTVLFSEPMNAASISTNTVMLYDAASNNVSATVLYNAGTLTATLNPLEWMDGVSTYTAVVLGGPSGVTDVATNALTADYSWSFTTGESSVINPYEPLTLEVDADTYLTNDEKNGPTDAHGTKSQIEMRWHEVRIHMGYVRFDITGVPASMLDGSIILSGSFTADNRNNAGTWNVYGVDDSVGGDNWAETSINYATAAGVDPSAPINSFGITNAMLLGTITLDGNDPTNGVAPTFISNSTNLNLGAFLTADTDGKVTFIIIDDAEDGSERYLDSKEGLNTGGHGPMKLNFIPLASPPSATTINYLTGSGSSMTLGWEAIADHSYFVERTADIQYPSWMPLTSGVVTNSYTDTAPPTGDQAFYRVVDEGINP